MEGPSLFLAAEQLKPFEGNKIMQVRGNTKIDKERLVNQIIRAIFSYGKYLFFQFDTFALRVHFLLWGTFEAIIKGNQVTGDYPKKERTPRLQIESKIGSIDMYNCSLVFIESNHAQKDCDYSIDIMSEAWDRKKALTKMKEHRDEEIGDVLLDQTIFMGVGNIIKNEVLLLAGISPTQKIKNLSQSRLKEIEEITRQYVLHFYEWRKHFELRKHYMVYRQSICKQCGTKVFRLKTGLRNRMSYICPHCQK